MNFSTLVSRTKELWSWKNKKRKTFSTCRWTNSSSKLNRVSAIFYQICISHQMKLFKNYEKCFLFHLKSSFRSRDIQIFVFLSFPLFPPVSHCFRGWWNINLKVYDVINCLNKDLITHFVLYLEKEKSYDIQLFSIDSVLNKEHFYGKVMQKMCTKS